MKLTKMIAVDTETTGLSAWHGDLPYMFTFCNEEGETFCVEWEVDPFTRIPRHKDGDIAVMREIMEDRNIIKVFHNAKFDMRMFKVGIGVLTLGQVHDTMYMARAVDSLSFPLALKPLCERYCGIGLDDVDELSAATRRARRIASNLGWKIAYEETEKLDGSIKKKAQVPADYWIPRQMVLDHKDRVPFEDRKKWKRLCRTYGVLDAVRTMTLAQVLMVGMKENRVTTTYKREMKLLKLTQEMEERGVRVRPEIVQREKEHCLKQAAAHYKAVEKKAWKGINLDAPMQVAELVYNNLKLKVHKCTDKGNPSVDMEALRPHKDHPVVSHIVKYRAMAKAVGTFFSRYQRLMLPDQLAEGCFVLHPSFNQAGTVTGRYSCSDPNLQQATSPETTKSDEPVHARTPFGPRPGYVWILADYSGMEVRVFADVAQEPYMLAAIKDGRIIHDEICNKVWGGKGNPKAITEAVHALELDGTGAGQNPLVAALHSEWGVKQLRKLTDRDKEKLATSWLDPFLWDIVKAQASIGKKITKGRAKQLTFLKVYGGGVKAAASHIQCKESEARIYMDDYDSAFPRIREFADELSAQARADGYIRTLWGRRLSVAQDKLYRCVNYLVQGSSADLVKSAMLRCARYMKENGIDGHIIMTIHDELVFEIRRTHCTMAVVRDLCTIMEDTEGRLEVPMPVEPQIVKVSWNSKRKIKGWK